MERVVGLRTVDGQLQVKVRWEGYGEQDDEWLQEYSLDCPTLIDEFISTSGDKLFRVGGQ